MKKLLTIVAAAAAMSLTLGSCLDNSDGASATMTYFGTCDTIIYSDSAANYYLDSLIKVGIREVGCTYNAFSEHADVPESQMIYAVAKCNEQAVATWKNMVSQLTLKDIANSVYKHFSDTLSQHMGIHSAAELNLKPFTVKTQLYSIQFATQQSDYMYLYAKEIK